LRWPPMHVLLLALLTSPPIPAVPMPPAPPPLPPLAPLPPPVPPLAPLPSLLPPAAPPRWCLNSRCYVSPNESPHLGTKAALLAALHVLASAVLTFHLVIAAMALAILVAAGANATCLLVRTGATRISVVAAASVRSAVSRATARATTDIESRGADGISVQAVNGGGLKSGGSEPALERVTTTTNECYLCYDSCRGEHELVRGVCACKHTAMHLSCQRRMIEMAEEAGKPNPLQCTVCHTDFSNAEFAEARVKLTRAGARWLLIAVGSVVLLACAVAALWPWDGERMGWWDYAWRSFLNYEDVSLDGQHTLLRFFGLLALVAAICLSSWTLTWLALSLSGTLDQARQRPDAAGLGFFLQPPMSTSRQLRCWQPTCSA